MASRSRGPSPACWRLSRMPDWLLPRRNTIALLFLGIAVPFLAFSLLANSRTILRP